MGSTKLWLPSRRSVDSHRGALSSVLFGHWRSGRLMGGNFLYFLDGSLSLQWAVVNFWVPRYRMKQLQSCFAKRNVRTYIGILAGRENRRSDRWGKGRFRSGRSLADSSPTVRVLGGRNGVFPLWNRQEPWRTDNTVYLLWAAQGEVDGYKWLAEGRLESYSR